MLIRSGDLLIDLGGGEVRRGEETLEVSGLTWELLAALAQAVPDPVSMDQLAKKV